MNATRLRSILNDLYALDPSLRAQEPQLLPLIEMLLKTKPDATPDPAFVERLRMLLKERAAQSQPATVFERFASFFSLPRLAFGMSGAIVGMLLGIIVLPLWQNDIRPEGTQRAFGDPRGEGVQQDGMIPPLSVTGRGGGGDAGIGTTPMIAPADPGMPPFASAYAFSFEGALPPLPQGTVSVFKRERNTLHADATKMLRELNIDLLDLTTFADSDVDSLNFIQQKPYGYTFNIALREGMLSLYQNWEQWPHPESDCQDEACFRRYQQTPDDIPDDDAVIAVADAFVREHDIDLTSYGPPAVDTSWRMRYDSMTEGERSTYSIGDVVRVIYPFFLENTPVVDASGTPVGISVGINIREMKVQEVSGIMDRTYQSSAYAAADEETIRRYLDTASSYPGNVYPEGAERTTVAITLGTPTLGYATVSVFDENRMDELLVPALIFPVTNVPEGADYYNTSVIVPLATDLLKRDNAGGGVMPFGGRG